MNINKKKYAILQKCEQETTDNEMPFYGSPLSNNIDMELLGMCIGHIRLECATFEEFKEKLLTDEYQALAFFVYDLYFDEIAYRPETEEVAVCSGKIETFPDRYIEENPELSKEELLDYEYKMPVDEFFTVTKKSLIIFMLGRNG